jgi:hypothetical protein
MFLSDIGGRHGVIVDIVDGLEHLRAEINLKRICHVDIVSTKVVNLLPEHS